MPSYKYKSYDSKGEMIMGSIEAVDRAAALYAIKQRGLLPVEVYIDKSLSHALKKIIIAKVPVKDLAVFCRQFATILSSGVTALSAMDILRRQTSNRRLRKAVELAYLDLQKGRTLSQSFRARVNVFPELLINMVESGEVNGALDYAMLRMAIHYEKENWINQKIKSAMTYPTVLLTASVLMVVFMVYFILPSFMTLIDTSTGDIPEITKMVIGTAEFVRTRWYYIFIFLSLIIGIIKYAASDQRILKLHHKLMLHIPVLGKIIMKIIASRFARTVGILLASGIPLLSALESSKSIVKNALAEEAIEKSIVAVRNGQDLAIPLRESGVFDPMLVRMVQIGEQTGTLDEMLTKTADFFDSEVEAGIGRLMLLIEPAMLILMGIVVGTVVMAMLLPMYSMLGNLGV